MQSSAFLVWSLHKKECKIPFFSQEQEGMDEVSGLGNESVKLVGEEKYSAMTVSRDGSLNRVSQVAFFTILAEETWSRRIEFLPTAICTIVTKAGNGFSSRPYVDHLSKA